MKNYLLLFTCLLPFSILFAQKSPAEFGDIAIEELKRQFSPIDSTAGVERLFEFGLTTFDHQMKIVFEHHVRLKIYNNTELDRGNVKIPYNSKDRVSKLKASTYNFEGGKIIEHKIEKANIFDENVRDGLKQKRLSMPNVKVGSIIEYSYIVNYGSWRSLNPWYFQASIPVRYSEYVVSLPEYFKYQQNMTGYVTLADYITSSKTGNYRGLSFGVDIKKYVAKNVPAFKTEPYMTSRDNYISKIKFDLASVSFPDQMTKIYIPASYDEMSKEIAEEEYYGKTLEKNRFLKDELETIASETLSDDERVRLIYNYVRDTFEIDKKVQANEIRRIFNLKKGYRSDINRVLVALYREAGYEADIVRISTRRNGKINPYFPMRSSLNYTITLLRLNGEDILLDPSEKDIPFGVLPEKCLNGRGVLITNKNFKWVDLSPKAANKISYLGKFELDEEGILIGNIGINRMGYNAIDFRNDHKKDIEQYKKSFAEGKSSWYIDEHLLKGVDEIEKSVTQQIDLEIEDHAELTGNLMIFNPIVYARSEKNPFETEERLFPVDYGSPYKESIIYSIKIPDGYVVDELPQQLVIGLPDNGGRFLYSVQNNRGQLIITSRFSINKVVFESSEYPTLREFYAQVVAKQAENVVLKFGQ